MQPRRFTLVLFKPILTISLIVLLGGIRFFCDLGTALSANQCLTQTNNSSRTEPRCTDGGCHDGHDRGGTEGSSPTPSDSPQQQCCTSWFVFAPEPNTNLGSSNSHELVFDVANPPAPASLNSLMAAGYRLQYLSLRNRAPNTPLYLATRSIRV
jgi:hypothetical protein